MKQKFGYFLGRSIDQNLKKIRGFLRKIFSPKKLFTAPIEVTEIPHSAPTPRARRKDSKSSRKDSRDGSSRKDSRSRDFRDQVFLLKISTFRGVPRDFFYKNDPYSSLRDGSSHSRSRRHGSSKSRRDSSRSKDRSKSRERKDRSKSRERRKKERSGSRDRSTSRKRSGSAGNTPRNGTLYSLKYRLWKLLPVVSSAITFWIEISRGH